MKASTRLLAAAVASAPRSILAQDCASSSSCETCAQSGCVWIESTAQCLSFCPNWRAKICTIDASVCEPTDSNIFSSSGNGDVGESPGAVSSGAVSSGTIFYSGNDDGGLGAGAIVGCVIGGLLLLLAILLCCKRYWTKPAPPPPIEPKKTEETVMSKADLGSHNSHKIDVHKCHSANCIECKGGGKIDSPINFMPADEGGETVDEEDTAPSEDGDIENMGSGLSLTLMEM